MNIKQLSISKGAALRLWILAVIAALGASFALADAYRVANCQNSISLRTSPSTSASRIATVPLGQEIEVHSIREGWAYVSYGGQDGYVLAQYLEQVPQPVPEYSKEKGKKPAFLSGLRGPFSRHSGNDFRWLVWVVLGIFALQLICARAIDDSEALAWIMPITTLLIAAAELVYTFNIHNFIWFCQEPKWYFIVLNFLIFGFITFYQAKLVIEMCHAMSNDRGHLGIYSVPAAVILLIILGFAAPKYAGWVLVAFLVCQLVQAGIIAKSAFRGGLAYSILCTATYLAAMTATIIVCIHFLVLLIIVVIGFIVLKAIGSGSGSGVRLRHKYGDYYEDQYGNEWEWMGGNRYRRT